MNKYFSTVLLLGIAASLRAQLPAKTITGAAVPVTTNAAIARPVIAFKVNATYISGEPVANNTAKKIDFNGHPLFDESKNFSMEKDEFTAPSDGIYHFDVRVGWDRFSAPGMITVRVLTNWYSAVPAATFLPASITTLFDTDFSTLLSLKTGDKISVEVLQNSGAQQTYKQTQFSGYKIN